MKKIISISLVCIMITGLLTGCGDSLDADCNTVYVQKKGTVIGASIEKMDKDYYKEDELEDFIDEKVEAYQTEHDKSSVKVSDFSVKDGVAELFMKYAGYEDYQEFNDVKEIADYNNDVLKLRRYFFSSDFISMREHINQICKKYFWQFYIWNYFNRIMPRNYTEEFINANQFLLSIGGFLIVKNVANYKKRLSKEQSKQIELLAEKYKQN